VRSTGKLIRVAIACAFSLLLGSTTLSAQPTVDGKNRYPNVGVIMAWSRDRNHSKAKLKC
jgi:hypothetical protein